jgi:hypothetical protein
MLPIVVSPYLRPFVEHGRLYYDDAVRARVHHLDPIQDRIVQALWPPLAALPLLDAVVEEHGIDAVSEALESLLAERLVFESVQEATAYFTDALESLRLAAPGAKGATSCG